MYHFRVKIIGRSRGGSAAGAAAYRAGGRSPASALSYRTGEVLADPLTGQRHDYRSKGRIDADGFGVVHTEVIAPAKAPEWVFDLQQLVNRVEAAERRRDAQQFRELEISLPRELSLADQRTLLRAFVQRECVNRGMVAIIVIHDERAADGGRNPHAHVMLTMRDLKGDGFGLKVRAWNSRELLQTWRKTWAEMANAMLKARGHEARLDHRSFRDRDIELEPDAYIGPTKAQSKEGVIARGRVEMREEVKERNRSRALTRPPWFLEQITRMQSTFSLGELDNLIRRYTGLQPGSDEAIELKKGVLAAPDLLRIPSDVRGGDRFTTHSLFGCEVRLLKGAEALAQRSSGAIHRLDVTDLSESQRKAAQQLLSGADLVALEGVAGAGKSFLLSRVRAAFEKAGHRVRGVALSSIVARTLGKEAGMPSQTIRSLLTDLEREAPHAPLQRGDVVVLDEAGLVGSRQLERIVSHIERAGAKLVLVGDTRQLQSIEAGAAFRAIVQRHGAAKLGEVRRQHTPAHRDATEAFARGRTAKAMEVYVSEGAVRSHRTREDAMRSLIFDWVHAQRFSPSQLILAHTRDDAAKLNNLARLAMRAEGRLGDDVSVSVLVAQEIAGTMTERRDKRAFAIGDDILFTRNEAALGVQNGSLGRLIAIKPGGEFHVRLPDGQTIAFNPTAYPHLEHGYAMTVHKAQGVTVDRAFVFASRGFDAHMTYVAMTRHRDQVGLYYGDDDFAEGSLIPSLSRDRFKDFSLDYVFDPSVREQPSIARDTISRERGLDRD